MPPRLAKGQVPPGLRVLNPTGTPASDPSDILPTSSQSIGNMDKMLDLYKVVAERETGFWVGLPIATGQTISRDEWLRMMEDDPEHFQLATFTAEELTRYSMSDEDVIERAVSSLGQTRGCIRFALALKSE